jgi:predicted nucleotidyltransferase
MTVEWPWGLPDWATAEHVLHEWRARIERIAARESAHFAGLPYVTGVAIVGTVGRGNAWPLSDVDLLIMADPQDGHDPEDLVRAVEQRRNEALLAQRVPNPVEAGNWVLLTRDVASAVQRTSDEFLSRAAHPHWLGTILKAAGGRVVGDTDGLLEAFLRRADAERMGVGFVRVWLDSRLAAAQSCLVEAEGLLGAGDAAAACRQVIRASDALAGAAHARWRRVPQRLAHGASRLLAAARAEGEPGIGGCFLGAARLREPEVMERFPDLPPAGRAEQDVHLAVRRGVGEGISELDAARDVLNGGSRQVMSEHAVGPWPVWTGVTSDARAVGEALGAAREMLRLVASPGRGAG